MTLFAVFIGGIVGTALRIGIDALLPHTAPGSFALGLLVARVWPTAPAWLRAGLGTGVLGAFTTFSAVVISLIELTTVNPEIGVLYLGASLVLGLGAAWLGLRLGGAHGTRTRSSREEPA